jgi:hypothetical protein
MNRTAASPTAAATPTSRPIRDGMQRGTEDCWNESNAGKPGDGVTENAIRKLIGPSKPANAQLG